MQGVIISNTEQDVLGKVLYLVGNAMKRDTIEPESSDLAYIDNGDFVCGMSKEEYKTLQKLVKKFHG